MCLAGNPIPAGLAVLCASAPPLQTSNRCEMYVRRKHGVRYGIIFEFLIAIYERDVDINRNKMNIAYSDEMIARTAIINAHTDVIKNTISTMFS